MRVSHILKGTRPVAVELALYFGQAIDQSQQYWLNPQSDYVLKTSEAAIAERLNEVPNLSPG